LTDKKDETRFYDLIADYTPPRALENACRFVMVARSLRPPINPTDLLKPGALRVVMWQTAQIAGWLPVSSKTIHGYASWLGRWQRVKTDMLVTIDANLWQQIHMIRIATARTRAQSKFMAITAHEIGHVLMRRPEEPVEFVEDMGEWVAAPWATLKAEAEAWLFAGFLRAFIFADIGSEKRPDETHKYV